MTIPDALLAAIVADPDADTPRLVYADWLDDHGQPERADLIRGQCYLTRTRGEADAPDRERWARRVREVARTHSHRWRKELYPVTNLSWGPFQRGMVESVSVWLGGNGWPLTDLDRLTGLTPLRVLQARFSDWRSDIRSASRTLLGWPGLRRFRTLDLSVHVSPFDRNAWADFVQSLCEHDWCGGPGHLIFRSMPDSNALALLAGAPTGKPMPILELRDSHRMDPQARDALLRRYGERIRL